VDKGVHYVLETIPIEIVYYIYKDSYLEGIEMDNNSFIDKKKEQITRFFAPDKERIERLRVILEKEQNRQVTRDEAENVGIELIGLFECLGSDPLAIKKARKFIDGKSQ
jgi:hypothetical protein